MIDDVEYNGLNTVNFEYHNKHQTSIGYNDLSQTKSTIITVMVVYIQYNNDIIKNYHSKTWNIM